MTKIYKSGYLEVSQNDKIYFECKGNKNAFPILNIHGWPWDNFKGKDENYFDLEKNNVIFYDQRRWGKSVFSWENILQDFDTNTMIEDILKLIKYLKIEKINLFWGSWWSTLALIFAIRNPEKVNKIIVRWIYLAWETFETEYMFWNWAEKFYPDAWEKFLENIPENFRDNKKIYDYIWEEIQKKNYKPLLALNKFEWSIWKLDWKERFAWEIDYSQKSINSALIEFYFIKNMCFIEKDYILKNAKKLKNIFVSIIQWRYDIVCPAENAWKLDKALDNSKLQFVIWGHSGSEKNMFEAIKKEVENNFW